MRVMALLVAMATTACGPATAWLPNQENPRECPTEPDEACGQPCEGTVRCSYSNGDGTRLRQLSCEARWVCRTLGVQ